jgi:hypothetical protein
MSRLGRNPHRYVIHGNAEEVFFLTPGNVMLTKNGAKVLDFRLEKSLTITKLLTVFDISDDEKAALTRFR